MQLLDIVKNFSRCEWILSFFLVSIVVLLLGDLAWAVPYPINAKDDQPIIKVLCQVILFVIGPFGKAIAIIVVLCTGFMILVGKASMPLFLILVAGIGVLFGAPNLVFLLINATQRTAGNLQELCELA